MSDNASAVQLNKLRAIGAGSVAHQQRRDDVFRLEDAARTMAQCRDLLATIALDMGMTGDTAEAAKNSLLALQKTTSQQVGHLSEASNAASMAHIAVNHAAAAIAALPETGLTQAQTATLKTPAKNAIAARVSDAAAFSPGDLDDLQADLSAEITYRRHLVPLRPPRSYVRSQKRPGGRFPTKRPGDRLARRPRTKVIFLTLPARTQVKTIGSASAESRFKRQPPLRQQSGRRTPRLAPVC